MYVPEYSSTGRWRFRASTWTWAYASSPESSRRMGSRMLAGTRERSAWA
jgi:hypothetical protein